MRWRAALPSANASAPKEAYSYTVVCILLYAGVALPTCVVRTPAVTMAVTATMTPTMTTMTTTTVPFASLRCLSTRLLLLSARPWQLVTIIREIEAKYKHPICILADLQGPKLRVGVFEKDTVRRRRRVGARGGGRVSMVQLRQHKHVAPVHTDHGYEGIHVFEYLEVDRALFLQ